MKKIALLLALAAIANGAYAQITLSGTSYTQNFDGIGAGLPTGWSVQTGASATTPGTPAAFTGATLVAWRNTTGAFKNFASADGLTATATAADQDAATDRSLGVRQTSAVGDPGAAFVLQIANTSGKSNFQLSFKLQSLDDSSTRTTTWAVDYGFGAMPSMFTAASATGTLTTGNSTFSNNTINVNFGNALDGQAANVWIRIVALTPSTGTNKRASTGIDDYSLTWTNSGAMNYRPNLVSMMPADNSTNVTANANLSMVFDRKVSAGTGNIYLKNETTQATTTIAANAANVNISNYTVTISNTNIVLGNAYHVTFDSTAFDTAGFRSYGIYDTTSWNFSADTAVVGPVLTSINETFDAACAAGGLPTGWIQENVIGTAQKWRCALSNTYLEMNGFSGGNNDNEDWLITPKLNLTMAANPMLYFRGYKGFTGDPIDVLVSSNYTGSGAPSAATWTSLNINFSAATNIWANYSANLTSFQANQFYIAFKYVCSAAAANCAQWRIDSVVVQGTLGINSAAQNNQLPVSVLGHASNTQVLVAYSLTQPAIVTATFYDLAGRKVFAQTAQGVTGANRLSLQPADLPAGLYILQVSDGVNAGVTKVVME